MWRAMSYPDLFTDCLLLASVVAVAALGLYAVIAGTIELVPPVARRIARIAQRIARRIAARRARHIEWIGSDER